MAGISDQVYIKAVRSAYRKKGRPVTVKDVVSEMKGTKKPPKRPGIMSRVFGFISNYEVGIALDNLSWKKKIRKVLLNKKKHYKPL